MLTENNAVFQSFWSQHHGDVPYTIICGTEDPTVPPETCEMMRDAAPTHAACEKLVGADHDIFSSNENWPLWTVQVAAKAEQYLLGPSPLSPS